MGNTPQIIKHLLIINIIFFIGTKFSGQISTDFLALHYFENDKFFISQMLTHMFMHGNEAHLLFNMFGLWMFGSTLANIWGTNKFIFFYLSSGLGAAVIQMLAYYFNIESITSALAENGLSNESIVELFRSGTVNTSVFEYVSKESIASVYNDYKSQVFSTNHNFRRCVFWIYISINRTNSSLCSFGWSNNRFSNDVVLEKKSI